MDILDSVMEMIGVLDFAVSGALVAVRHRMDLFGVIMLGIITALGGGVIRDVILGIVPPSAFQSPVQGLTAAGAAVLLFLPVLRRRLTRDARFDALLQLLGDGDFRDEIEHVASLFQLFSGQMPVMTLPSGAVRVTVAPGATRSPCSLLT